ncbi:MAG: stage II sporulation protein M [Methanobacteriaceae archaeon]|nr:stage II sporulation protein M [Methanobacteriaceae archaeon]MDP3486264.1 stage II sporulation protein M [Methanobacteriaceae archaeon]
MNNFVKGFLPSKISISLMFLALCMGAVITCLFSAQILGLQLINDFYSTTYYGTFFEEISFLFVVFSSNLMVSFIIIIGGLALIIPFLVLVMNFIFIGTIISAGILEYGLIKTLILIFGLLNTYPEFLAILLAFDSGLVVLKTSFKTYKNDWKTLFRQEIPLELKDILSNELMNTVPRIIFLLLFAAILETLWAPFWHNYWFYNII